MKSSLVIKNRLFDSWMPFVSLALLLTAYSLVIDSDNIISNKSYRLLILIPLFFYTIDIFSISEIKKEKYISSRLISYCIIFYFTESIISNVLYLNLNSGAIFLIANIIFSISGIYIISKSLYKFRLKIDDMKKSGKIKVTEKVYNLNYLTNKKKLKVNNFNLSYGKWFIIGGALFSMIDEIIPNRVNYLFCWVGLLLLFLSYLILYVMIFDFFSYYLVVKKQFKEIQ